MLRTLARPSGVLAGALALTLLGSSLAYADDLVSDGDGAVPVSANALAFGTVCVGTAQSRTVAFAVKRNGSGQVFANSAVVSFSLVSAPSGVTGGSFGTVTLPSNWGTVANNTLSSATTGVVTIDTASVRTYSGNVTFRASGARNTTGTLTRDDTIAVSASVVSCDTTPPVLTLPGPITAEATGASGATVTYTATATDAVDGPRPVTCSQASGTTFPIAATTVSCSASDTAGNTATGSFTVTVRDTTGPALSLPPNKTLEATGPSGAVATFTATATDVVDGARPVTCTPPSGSTFAIATTTVSCTASDTRGNATGGSFTVKVQDTTAPVLTLPAPITAEATGPSGAAVTYTATASDIADSDVGVECTPVSGATFPLGTTTVHCTATDDAGNSASGSFTVTVGDSTAPEVSISGPDTVEATGPGGAAVTYTATAHDTVDGDLAPSCTPASGTTFALGTTTVGCSAVDSALNTGSATHDVEVVDTTAPDLTLPSGGTVEATGPDGATVPYATSASDLVDGAVTVTCDHPSTVFALGTTTVHCSATDAHHNTATGSFTVTVVDTTAPALTLPGDRTVEATGPSGAAVLYDATALDDVDTDVPVGCAPVSGSVFALGTTTVSCSATDDAGNTATGSFDVTVRDTTDPVLHTPGGVLAEATGPDGAAVTYLVTADDVVDTGVDVDCLPASGSVFALGTSTVSCTATDDAGNDVTQTFDVVVQDTTAPVVTVPPPVTAEATGPDGATVPYTATAADAVDTDVDAECAPESGTVFALGTTTVTCTATDDAGNTSEPATFTVTVADTTPPALTLPGNQTVEATGPAGAAATYTASATDAVDTDVEVECAPASGATFAIGTTTVSCSVADDAGNTSSGTFDVTVADTTAPAITVPANIVEEATGPSGNAVTFTATAHDVVDGDRPVTCTPPSGSTFALGTTTVSCAASDTRGNGDTASFTVTVKDESAPDLTLPANATVEATGPGGATYTYTATAHDTVDGDLTPACDPASGATFPLGTTPVGCTATDAHGNTGTGGFTVEVVDTTAPVVTVPGDLTKEATSASGAVATFTATATDAVSGSPVVTCTPPSGATFPLGTTTVTCTATDGAGNTGSASFHVTVVDTTAPVVTVPAAVTAEATGPGGATVTYAASAADAVSTVTPACNPATGTTFGLGTTTVLCTATDGAGNTGSAHFDVHVVDTHAPSLTVPADFAVTATTAYGAAVAYSTSAIDTVSGSLPVVCSPASGAAFGMGSTLVGCTATDGAGNTAARSFTVSVRYRFSGFLQPVNDTAHQTGVSESRFKLGSTVPLKFQLGTLGSASVQQVGSPSFAKVYRGASCDTATAAETAPDTGSTSGTVFRWDVSQYIYNFSTKGLTAGEWRVFALTADGGQGWVDLCLTR